MKGLNEGFTLLELLVVVLIIGILAAIALPQYRRTVEKAKVAEALVNVKAIEDSMQRYVLGNNFPTETTYFKTFADIELSGGEWTGHEPQLAEFSTDNFLYYWLVCGRTACSIELDRRSNSRLIYGLTSYYEYDTGWVRSCFTDFTEMGRYICRYLEDQGWKYIDREY